MLKRFSVVALLLTVLSVPGCAGLFGPTKAQMDAAIREAAEELRAKQEGQTTCMYSYRESDDQSGNKKWSKSRSCKGKREILGEPSIPESRDMIVTPQ